MTQTLHDFYDGKNILITGGTGSFGSACTEELLTNYNPSKIIIFSRDELKQHEMLKRLESLDTRGVLRFFIGDVRNAKRLLRAFEGVHLVFHAAAMKQVPACEYNPSEAISTNVQGTQNVVEAAIDACVERVLMLNTDKAVNPVNLYGATKLCAEKLILDGAAYGGSVSPKFACTRYGNVMSSRGSVLPIFIEQALQNKTLELTEESMTRFWLTVNKAVQFALESMLDINGGEVFIPKLPSILIRTLGDAVQRVIQHRTSYKYNIIGIRDGEKIHETLISPDETYKPITKETNRFIINRKPSNPNNQRKTAYTSDSNAWWLSPDEINSMIKEELNTNEPT